MSTPVLLIELGVVILGLAVLARFAERAGFSPIPLYLLVGLAFGDGGILPVVTSEEFIEVGAEIGVILLLLMLGLEYAGDELTESLRKNAAAGALDLALNFTPGFAAGLLLGWGPLAAVILGGITYVSSSGIVARVVQELGWVANAETPTVLSILVIEDLAMAGYLPLIGVLLRGEDPASAGLAILAAVGAVLVTLFVAVRFGPFLSRLAFSRSDEGLLLTIVGIALVVAGLAERLQVSAAVGAFLVGIALSGHAADRARVLLTPLRDLFAAVFFIFFSLQIDPSEIPSVLGVAAALALVTGASKVATGWVSAGIRGLRSGGRLRAGTALIARGEFSVVIAGLAVGAGVEPSLGPLTATYVLILATIGPFAAQAAGALSTRGAGRRESRPEEGEA
ncbi:MAG TPA: cation:proton antiporter [Actinomycetota bacterium]